jgi:hypothetical protein
MKKIIIALVALMVMLLSTTACVEQGNTAAKQEAKAVNYQQDQYNKAQPIPAFDWSLERDNLIKLYHLRNEKVATHSVWRSDYGMVEGDCASIGYGIPYDTSLTNPLVATDIDNQGEEHAYHGGSLTSIEQPEPNGIFASKNTAATWVMCVDKETNSIAPVYVESHVTVYPYPVRVDYEHSRVKRVGKASATISIK